MIADIELSARLAHALQEGIDRAERTGRPTLVSVVEPVARFDPLAAFAACPWPERFYWHPAGGPVLTGCGSAHAIPYHSSRLAEESWRELLDGAIVDGDGAPGTGPILTGSLAFDPLRTRTPLWDEFPLEQLSLPRILLTAGEQYSITVNTVVDASSNANCLAYEASSMAPPLLAATLPDAALSEASLLDKDDGTRFRATVARAIDTIRLGSVDKIVVARPVQFEGSWEVAEVLRRLQESQPHCTTFAVGQGDICFVGATPEWLVRLHGGAARIDCLAGTAPRGRREQEDASLGEALLANPKERREHALVLEMVLGSLGGLAMDVYVPPEPSLMKLPNLQHLSTPITAVICGRTVLSLVKRLHPTPAVAGFPREVAMSFLRQHEGLDRGAYAGPVGWMDRHGEGEFAVGIRSALLRGGTATAFAGCGIMAQSDPESEYRESRLKLRPIFHALGVSLGS